MVVALGPGKFYGSSLPRPRLYSNIKFNSDRVDPPVTVTDPLLSWANEAHWLMGGLSFKRLRLQGRIEGSIKKLRAHQKRSDRKKSKIRPEEEKIQKLDEVVFEKLDSEREPGPEPQLKKRARKLVDEFEKVADAGVDWVGYQTRSRKSESGTSPPVVAQGRRTSPRKQSVVKSSD